MKRPGGLVFDFRQIPIWLLAGWLLFNLAQSIRYIAADYSPIPVEDYWRIAEQWGDAQRIDWTNLWRQHNEHRILFPELIFVADRFLLRGRQYLPIAVSGVCYLGVWVVLAIAAQANKLEAWPERAIGLLLAGVVMTWKGASSVIATPFQLQFTLMQLSSALSFLFLSKLADSGRREYLYVVIAGCVICNYTSSNGMLLWLIVVGVAAILRVKADQLSLLSRAGSLSILLFFYHYHFRPGPIGSNLRYAPQGLAFVCSYFSMPFGGAMTPKFGIALGAVNLLLMAGCAVLGWRRGLLRSRLATVLFGVYSFTIVTAVLTTEGRMQLTDSAFDRAKAWRYVTLPTVSWALLAIALVWLAGTWKPRWRMVAGVSLAIFFGFGFLKNSDWVESTREDSANAQMTAMMLLNGVFDPEQARTIFPDANFVREYSGVLQRARASIYARGGDKWLGRSLLTLPVSTTPVSGEITRVVPVPGGLEILGWADETWLSGDHAVLFVNEENRIIGFGRRPGPGMPAGVSSWDTPNRYAFAGYVSLAKPMSGFRVYVQTFHGKWVQPLGGKVEVPAFTQVDAETESGALAGVEWSKDEGWRMDGYPKKPENGRAPGRMGFGNYTQAIPKSFAVQTAPFPTPDGHCLVLPVLHGKPAYGQAVEVRDADSGQSIAGLPFVDGRSVWERWRIAIPAATQHLTVLAQDEGTGPNEWLAVASPERCAVAGNSVAGSQ